MDTLGVVSGNAQIGGDPAGFREPDQTYRQAAARNRRGSVGGGAASGRGTWFTVGNCSDCVAGGYAVSAAAGSNSDWSAHGQGASGGSGRRTSALRRCSATCRGKHGTAGPRGGATAGNRDLHAGGRETRQRESSGRRIRQRSRGGRGRETAALVRIRRASAGASCLSNLWESFCFHAFRRASVLSLSG